MMREMVLPEEETKIFNESLGTRLKDTNQQMEKWLTRWKPLIDHSMKRVKELAQANSKPIWQHFTANKPAKTGVSRKLSTGKHSRTIRMTRSTSRDKAIIEVEEQVIEDRFGDVLSC
jgi:hypothetical protein